MTNLDEYPTVATAHPTVQVFVFI